MLLAAFLIIGELQEASTVRIVNFTPSRESLEENQFVELAVALKNFGSEKEKVRVSVDSKDLAPTPSYFDYDFQPFEEKILEFRLIGGDAEEPRTVYFTITANGTSGKDTKTGSLILKPSPTIKFIVQYYWPLQIGLGAIALVLFYIYYKDYLKRKKQREAEEDAEVQQKKLVKGKREEK